MKFVKNVIITFTILSVLLMIDIGFQLIENKHGYKSCLKKVYLRHNIITGSVKKFDDKPIEIMFVHEIQEYNKSITVIYGLLNEKL